MSIVITILSIILLISEPGGTLAAGIPRAAETTEALSGGLTLQKALSLTFKRNPELIALSWEINAREADMLQAGQLPNPEISLEIEDIGGSAFTGVDQMEATLTLQQRIQPAGKRQKRRHVAALTQSLAVWDHKSLRLNLYTRLSLRFITVLGDQEKVTLNDDLLQLARQVAETVSKRVEAGKVSPIEAIKTNVTRTSAEIDLGRSKRQLKASRKKLAVMWGSLHPRFQSVEGELILPPTLPSFEKLAARLIQNPALARWQNELQMRRAVIDLAEAEAFPDITLGGGFRQFKARDTNTFVAGISIELPVFNRNRGGIQKARAKHQKALAGQRASALHLRTVFTEVYRILSSRYAEAYALKNKLLPGAKKAFEAIKEGYRLGKFNLLEVLDAQRTLAEARVQYLQARIDYQKAFIQVEGLIAEPLGANSSTDIKEKIHEK